jgi:hypothetical protein
VVAAAAPNVPFLVKPRVPHGIDARELAPGAVQELFAEGTDAEEECDAASGKDISGSEDEGEEI